MEQYGHAERIDHRSYERQGESGNLADYIQGILSRKAQAGKTGYSQSLYNLKDAAKMLNFHTTAKDYLKGVMNGKTTIPTN